MSDMKEAQTEEVIVFNGDQWYDVPDEEMIL